MTVVYEPHAHRCVLPPHERYPLKTVARCDGCGTYWRVGDSILLGGRNWFRFPKWRGKRAEALR